MNTSRALNPARRVAYAFVGLLGGNAALLLFLLQNALRLRAYLLAMHMGEPALQIPHALEMCAFYAPFSFVGWLFVGVPIALSFSARSIKRLSWPLRVFVGAALGPLALFLVFVLLSHGHIDFNDHRTFTGTSSLWTFSILVSTVSFLLYAALLREESRGQTGVIFHTFSCPEVEALPLLPEVAALLYRVLHRPVELARGVELARDRSRR